MCLSECFQRGVTEEGCVSYFPVAVLNMTKTKSNLWKEEFILARGMLAHHGGEAQWWTESS